MAAGLGAKTLQEYLVSLGVKLDEKGMSKMEGFLKSSKLGFLALTGLMVTATTVATKWVKQLNEAELAYEKQAKAQHKSIEAVRASENALKAMGKTKQEIAKDKSLKTVYDDLVKMNKAMALPDASRGLSLVRSISQEFLKFKSTIQYAMQWVNYHIISKLEGPLTRIRDTTKAWRDRIQVEMPMWTAKIADGIAVFVRLLETAVRFGGDVIKFIQKLPTELKTMGIAVSALWSIIRAGPLGWLLGGLTALLLLLDDFYAYKNGESSALSGLWKSLDEGTFVDGILSMTQKGIDAFVEFLESPEFQSTMKTMVQVLLGVVGQLINGAVALLMDSLPKSVQDFLGWDPEKHMWRTDQKDVPVVSKGKEVVVEDQETIPSRDRGVVYKNTNGILYPILSKEYRDLPIDQVPQSVIDSLNYHMEHFGRGGEALLQLPEYKPGPLSEDEKTERENSAYEMLKGMLQGTQSDADLAYSSFYKNLKDAYRIEQGLLVNGENSQEYFDKIVDAILKGATQDYLASLSPYGSSVNGYQYNQWYEAYKNGTLVPEPTESDEDLPKPVGTPVDWRKLKEMPKKPTYGLDGDVEVYFDPAQVIQSTKEAVDVAQGAVTPITVPVIPVYGEDGDEETHFDPNWGKTHNALGGRYDKPTETTLVEHGEPEYVIPIKKLNRAIPLIRMMLAEIGDRGRQMLSDLGITPNTDIDELVASKGLGRPGGGSPVINVVNNYNNTVTANPVIHVYGSGDPQAAGHATYNAQERFLVRTLKAVVQSE